MTIQGPCNGTWIFNGKQIGYAKTVIASSSGNYTLLCGAATHTFLVVNNDRRFFTCAYVLGIVACISIALLVMAVANLIEKRKIERRINFVISSNPLYVSSSNLSTY